jgi:hypothetical protein
MLPCLRRQTQTNRVKLQRDRSATMKAESATEGQGGGEPEQLGAHMADLTQNPVSEHEYYLRDYIVAKIHGIDLTHEAPPAPLAASVTLLTGRPPATAQRLARERSVQGD